MPSIPLILASVVGGIVIYAWAVSPTGDVFETLSGINGSGYEWLLRASLSARRGDRAGRQAARDNKLVMTMVPADAGATNAQFMSAANRQQRQRHRRVVF